eukprot:gnl/TRDRNA2_/TRDRNA2_78069_c0_seq1.p1 gnl/TRDRNA2_/TRDRNA2_78069_c0~~gnl/TRDRNA2_/TRDRNA2_78069_c0_seq1.p1  ORF type:complete len:234 (+),score=30.77 gnl/TRDRNA2_/TRDRNA2_78069_c0_seq1:43-702(+)
MIPETVVRRISDLCAKHGVWLVIDNTYEYFSYESEGHPRHFTLSGEHIVNIFSLSKAYGMMGWRMGYIAYPAALKKSLLKVQDTIPICPTIASQKAAIAAMGAGSIWVKQKIASLAEQKQLVKGAIEATLGKDSILGGSGAIYLMIKLPASYQDDVAVVRWFAEKHRLCLIPGSACGAPGYVRVCYANLDIERSREAVQRLHAGLSELAAGSAVINSGG